VTQPSALGDSSAAPAGEAAVPGATVQSAGARFAASWVRLIALWILAGAAFKLFKGTPADLPAVVRDFPGDLGLKYKLAITAELAIAFVALLRPRWGWVPELFLLFVFDLVLTTQIAAGEANCGCFGGDVSVPPWLMLTIDSVLLAGLLLARPWSRLPASGVHWLAPAAAAALAFVAPWLYDREVVPGEVVADGQPIKNAYLEFPLEKWVGKDIWDTPLGQPPLDQYLDVNALPLDGLWVFWRSTCDHCAEHLKHLAENEHGERSIALIRLEEPNDTEANRVVHVLPDGNFVAAASLPPSISYILQTPGELVLEGGRITAGAEGVTSETGL